MPYGLERDTVERMHKVFAAHSAVKTVVLYGSRAVGNYRKGSDIDLTFFGQELQYDELRKIDLELDDLDLPYMIDASLYRMLDNEALKENIQRAGVAFYENKLSVPTGWKTARMGDVCKVLRGNTITRKQTKLGRVPVVAGGLAPAYTHNKANRPANTVTVSGSGANAGFVNFYDVPIYASDCSTVTPKHREELLPVFVFRFLQSQQKYIYENLKRGSAQPHVYPKDIAELRIPVLPVSAQKQVVTILDEAFAAIEVATANVRKNIVNARELFDRKLNHAFSQQMEGWVEKPLEEIGKTQTGTTPKTSDQSNYGDYISFVKPSDFNTDGTLDYDKDRLSERGAKGARKVPAGSVLMVCIGATIGKCGYCEQDVTTNQQVNALTPSDGSSSRFIYYQMLTKKFQRKVVRASGQATLPIINKSKWSALTIWLPPKVAEQNKIAAELGVLAEKTQRLSRIYERNLAHLAELKQSILHKAFTGELTAGTGTAERILSQAGL